MTLSSFLLKIDPTAFDGTLAVVPTMKSVRLDASDVGSRVFVWLDDQASAKSALSATAVLASVETLKIPQVRDPTKRKDAYRLTLSDMSMRIASPLTTDDLAPYRYSEGTGTMDTLGRLHRDRNDKIIRLSASEAEDLEARFHS